MSWTQTRGDHVRVSLPVPISVNASTGNVRGKGRVKTAAYNSWLDEAVLLLRVSKAKIKSQHWSYHAALPINYQRDCDNCLKPLQDALVKAGVTSDDRYCESGSFERSATADGMVMLSIQGLEKVA